MTNIGIAIARAAAFTVSSSLTEKLAIAAQQKRAAAGLPSESEAMQFLFEIEHNDGRITREWFSPSTSLRTEGDSDLDAALLAAREWHDSAKFIYAARDNTGKCIKR